ncbi:hypothetical protein [Caenimonas soli]|uniref:hypothetical protein n=1 Tax=Caenimonas soli TaxID=2735555 RepID=UPI001556182A|nr:hypothetical protein [Caenimonas soli]NPC55768.1 hypothetical protein [Caenimonas soli]
MERKHQPQPALPDTIGAARHVGTAVALAAALATLLLSWHRLYYGVDFTDEAFYVALPLRFALGDIPLKDEQSLAQFAGVLVLPLVRLFLWLSGGAEGIVLFTRHLHLGFTALVGLSVFLAVRRALHWQAALLTACICLVFVPFNIHGLSYNTMGCGFLTAGCFLSLCAREERPAHAWPWFLCGVSHSLAILVYPPLAAAALVFAVMVLFGRRPGRHRRLWSAYLGGGLAAAMVPLWLLWRAGLESLPPMAAYLASFDGQGRGMGKLADVAFGFWRDAPPLLLAAYNNGANGTASLYMIVAIALLGGLAYPFLARHPFARDLMRWVWIPSFAGGFATAWSSSNGAANACIGMFPAALAAVVLIQLALRELPAANRLAALVLETTALAVPLVVIVPLLEGGYADFYGEPVQLPKLTERVAAGPFKGIRTTPEKLSFIETFARDALPLIGPRDRILVFSDFPAGYLLAGVRPAVNSVWLPPASASAAHDRTPTFRYWEATGQRPDVVMLLRKSALAGDPLVDRLRSDGEYRPFADLGFATLLRRRAAP